LTEVYFDLEILICGVLLVDQVGHVIFGV